LLEAKGIDGSLSSMLRSDGNSGMGKLLHQWGNASWQSEQQRWWQRHD
jgi:hypothetical protein